jgi:hypothetical protein
MFGDRELTALMYEVVEENADMDAQRGRSGGN